MLTRLFPEHLTQLLPPFASPFDLLPRFNEKRNELTIQIRLLFNGENRYQDRVHKYHGSLLVIGWNPERFEFGALECHSVDTFPSCGYVSSLRAIRECQRNGVYIERDHDWEPKTVAEYCAAIEKHPEPSPGPVVPWCG